MVLTALIYGYCYSRYQSYISHIFTGLVIFFCVCRREVAVDNPDVLLSTRFAVGAALPAEPSAEFKVLSAMAQVRKQYRYNIIILSLRLTGPVFVVVVLNRSWRA
jgi:hypothetical protein